jgi:hypothetical protein
MVDKIKGLPPRKHNLRNYPNLNLEGEWKVELKIEIPPELEKGVRRIPREELSRMIVDFLRLKVFELELKRLRELQKLMLEMLSMKSKLTEEDAVKLGEKVKEGMLKELKEKGLI